MKKEVHSLLVGFLVCTATAAADPESDRELAKLAAQRDKAIEDAIEPINRRYQTALESLLRQASQKNDRVAAAKILEALDLLKPEAVGKQIPGTHWADGGRKSLLEFTANGTFREKWNGRLQEYRWKAISSTDVLVTFPNGNTNTYRMEDGGKSLRRLHDGITWKPDDTPQ